MVSDTHTPGQQGFLSAKVAITMKMEYGIVLVCEYCTH